MLSKLARGLARLTGRVLKGLALLTVILFVLNFTEIISVANALMMALNSTVVRPNLPAYGTPPDADASISPIIQLWKEHKGKARGFCSAFVVDANYAITAAHCIRDFYTLDEKTIYIHDEFGRDTKVKAKAVALSNRIDIGLIKGNFRKFKNLRADFYNFTPTNNPGSYIACGFPGLQNRVTCTRFSPTHSNIFHLSGRGFLIPGMSGGPVIDVVNKVVIGVNSSGSQGFVNIAPILGLLGTFEIEP